MKKIIEQGYNRAKDILTQNIAELHLLAKMLIEHETLSGQQIKNLLSDRTINSEEENLFPIKNNSDNVSDGKKVKKNTNIGTRKTFSDIASTIEELLLGVKKDGSFAKDIL